MSTKKYTLLLTACINPGEMIYTVVTDADIRRSQYIDALNYYLHETDLPIVFVENTGNDISAYFKQFVEEGRLECLTFSGNGFCKNKGKGYGEAGILQYAVSFSSFLQDTDFIIKITGRLKVLNIMRLKEFHRKRLPGCEINCILDTDFGFADSRLLIITLEFLQNGFLVEKENINDSQGIYLEHVLFDSIYNQSDFVFYPFFLRPLINGVSGTTGKQYWEGNYLKVKLIHLQKMLNCSILFNSDHPGNSSKVICIRLKIWRSLINICIFLLNILKGTK